MQRNKINVRMVGLHNKIGLRSNTAKRDQARKAINNYNGVQRIKN